MKEIVLSILGVVVIAVLTLQTATAAPRGAQRTRVYAAPTREVRDAFGSVSKEARSKSCDIFWCYAN